MELIRINDKKLKIMLTSSDMKSYALDVQKLSGGTEETRQAFRHLLHDAGIDGGFEPGNDKIYIQYYPSREGGCEMFITRLDQVADPSDTVGTPAQSARKSAKQEIRPGRQLAFRFDSLFSLLLACRALDSVLSSFAGRVTSSVYRDDRDDRAEKDQFYLLISAAAHGDRAEPLALSRILSEFGHKLSHQDVKLYLDEHGEPLCLKNAIETLGRLA